MIRRKFLKLMSCMPLLGLPKLPNKNVFNLPFPPSFPISEKMVLLPPGLSSFCVNNINIKVDVAAQWANILDCQGWWDTDRTFYFYVVMKNGFHRYYRIKVIDCAFGVSHAVKQGFSLFYISDQPISLPGFSIAAYNMSGNKC
jgi:hypothetical protein